MTLFFQIQLCLTDDDVILNTTYKECSFQIWSKYYLKESKSESAKEKGTVGSSQSLKFLLKEMANTWLSNMCKI